LALAGIKDAILHRSGSGGDNDAAPPLDQEHCAHLAKPKRDEQVRSGRDGSGCRLNWPGVAAV
jgi:hypothetical protein